MKSIFVASALCWLAAAKSSFPDFLRETSSKSIEGTDSLVFIAKPLDLKDRGQPCKMEVMVSEKIKGRCMRLGHGTNACVADTYLDLFNKDCAFIR